MKTIELKDGISKKFNISKKDIRLTSDNGWYHLYIRESHKETLNFTDYSQERDYLRNIEQYIIDNAQTYTFIADDGYNTEHSCINSSFNDFKYL